MKTATVQNSNTKSNTVAAKLFSNSAFQEPENKKTTSVITSAPANLTYDLSRLSVQPKLFVGAAGDRFEEEADRVADTVMRMPQPVLNKPIVQREVGERKEDDEELIQRISIPKISRLPMNNVQRACASCEKEKKEQLQRKPLSNEATPLNQSTTNRINNLKGRGQPLPESERNFFEPRFKRDFSSVRIHTDAQAVETAKFINARAFTLGNDIVLGQGEYQSGSNRGRRLLAHELTHTVQQNHLQSKNILQRQTLFPSPIEYELSKFEKVIRDGLKNIVNFTVDAIQVLGGFILGLFQGIGSFLYDLTIGTVVDIFWATVHLIGSLIYGFSKIFNLIFDTPTIADSSWQKVKNFFIGLYTIITQPLTTLMAVCSQFVKEFEEQESLFDKTRYVTKHATIIVLSVITLIKAVKAAVKKTSKVGQLVNDLDELSSVNKVKVSKAIDGAKSSADEVLNATKQEVEQLESEVSRLKSVNKLKGYPSWASDLKPPHKRHYLNRINKGVIPMKKNSVILPEYITAIEKDIQAIKEGNAIFKNNVFTINRRTYGHHGPGGRLFPIEGTGIISLNRFEYIALKTYKTSKNIDLAEKFLTKSNIPIEAKERALSIIKKYNIAIGE